MKKFFLILSFWLYSFGTLVFAQDGTIENVWGTLMTDVKIRYVYSLKYSGYLPKPKFGDDLKNLDGKEIIIKGFFLPVNVTGGVFVISFNPMNMCFFCTGSGIETILEINVKNEHVNKFKRLRTDNYVKVKGVLKLNGDDVEHLVYILNNVELMDIIR